MKILALSVGVLEQLQRLGHRRAAPRRLQGWHRKDFMVSFIAFDGLINGLFNGI